MKARTISAIAAAALAFVASRAMAADEALIAAAKKEGVVNWYTTLIVNQVTRPVVDAFQKKYGIRVNYTRANSQDIVLRAMNEAKAGKLQVDFFDGTSGAPAFKQANMLLKWAPDGAKNLPKEYIDPQGYWVAVSLYLQTFGFNTDHVKKGSEPKTLEDLLDPKWRGQMALSASSSTPGAGGFVGHVVTKLGEEKAVAYLKRLGQQKIAIMPVSARQVLDRVIAGEYAIGLQILNHHVAFSSEKGAPIGWTPIEDAMGALLVVGVFKDGPHTNAAKLLMDFLVSDEGQNIFRTANYIPVSPTVQPKDPTLRPDGKRFKARIFTPEEIEANTQKWMKIYETTLR